MPVIQLFDGTRLRLPDNLSDEEIDRIAKAKTKELKGIKPESGGGAALKSGIQNLLGAGAALAGRVGLRDVEEAQRAYEARKQRAEEIFQPNPEGWNAPVNKLLELAGGSLPYMAVPLAAGAAAAFAPVTGAAATALGLGAAGLASAGQFTGTNLARQLEEGKQLRDTDLAAAAAAAVPQALLDTIALRMMPGVGRIFGQAGVKVTKENAEAIAKQALSTTLKDYAVTTGGAMTREGVTEAAQQALERLQAGLSITDPQARAEYFESFVGGAVLGGAISPAGRFFERGSEQRQARGILDKQAQEAQAERLKQEEAEKQKPEYLEAKHNEYTALAQQKETLRSQIAKAAKGKPLSEEDIERNKSINEQLKALAPQLEQARKDYNAVGGQAAFNKLTEERRVAGLTPLEYQMEQFGVDLKAPAPEQRVFTGEDFIAQQPAAAPELQYATQQVQLANDQSLANQYEAKDQASVYVPYLMENPAAAYALVKNNTPIPGVDPLVSSAILEALNLQLTDLGEQISAGRETAGYERAQTDIEQQTAREAAALEQQRAALRQQQAEEAQIEREGMQAYAQRLAGRTQDRELGEATARMAGAEQLTPTMRLEQPGVTRVTGKGKTTTTVDQTARPEFTETLEPDRRVPPSPIKAINATLDQLQSATQVDDSTKELAARVQANLNPVLRQMYAQSQEETQRQQRLLSERGIAPPKPLVPESPLATLYSWARSAATGNPAPDLSARVEAALQSLAQGQVSETQPLLRPGRRELTAEERGSLAGTKAESRRKTAAFMPSGEMRQGVQLEIPLPEPTAKAFESFSKFNDFLASDALQAYRMQQGLTFPTISSLLRTLSPIQTRISELQQQVNQLNSQRKAVLTASADKKQSAEAQVKALEAQISKTLADFDTSVKGAYVAGMSKRMQKKYAPEAQGLLFGDVRTTVDAQGMARWGEGRAAPVVTTRVDPNRIANWGAADSPIGEAIKRYQDALAHKKHLDELLLGVPPVGKDKRREVGVLEQLSEADKARKQQELTINRAGTEIDIQIEKGKVAAYEKLVKAEENLRTKALAIIEANKALDAAVGTDKEKAARARAKQAKEEGVRAHFALMQAHKRVPTTEQLNDNFIKFLNAKTQLDEQLREAKKRLSGFKLALNSAKTRLNNVQVSVAESNPEVRARLDGLVNGLLNAERSLDAAIAETPAARRTAAELERQAAPLEQSKEALERMVSGQLEEAGQRAESRRKVEPEETPAERSTREAKAEQARLERVADMPGRGETTPGRAIVSFEPRRQKLRRILSEGAMAKVQARIKEITKLLSDEARAIYEEEQAARKGTTTEYKSLEPAERAKLIQELRALYKQQEAAIAASRQRYSEEKGAKVAAVDDEIEARKIEIAALEAERDSLMANAQLNKTEKKQVDAGKKTEAELLEARRAKIKAAKDGGNKGIINKKAILERLITAQAARKEELAKQAPGAKITPIPSRKERADTADKLRREIADRKEVSVNDLQYLDAAEAANLLREEEPSVIAGMLEKIGDPKASEILDKFAANIRNAVNASIETKSVETDADTLNAALKRLLTGKAARRAIGPVTRPEVFPPREMRTGSEESRAGATTTGSTNKLQEVRGAKQRDVPITKGEQQQANVDAAKLINDITTTRNALKNVDERLELIAKNPVPDAAPDATQAVKDNIKERKERQAAAKTKAENDKATLVAKLTELLEKQAEIQAVEEASKTARPFAVAETITKEELVKAKKDVQKKGLVEIGVGAKKRLTEAVKLAKEEAPEPEVEVEAFPTEGKYLFQLNDNQFSRGPTAEPSSVASLRAELGKVFPDLGRVQMYESVEALIAANPQYKGRIPADARGFVDSAGNKAFLIAENINKGQALGVLLHEVGAHVGLKSTLGDAQYNALVNAVKAWEKRNDGSTESKVAQAARRKVEAAETEAGHVNDELLAYAIEEAVNAGVKPMETKGVLGQWLTRIAQAFRKALEKFGLPSKALDAQGIVDMAFGAAKMQMTPAVPQMSRRNFLRGAGAALGALKLPPLSKDMQVDALQTVWNTSRAAYHSWIRSLLASTKTKELRDFIEDFDNGFSLADTATTPALQEWFYLEEVDGLPDPEIQLKMLLESKDGIAVVADLQQTLRKHAANLVEAVQKQAKEKGLPEVGELYFSKNLPNAARVANEIVGRQKSWSQRLRDNYLGMGFRAQYIDKFAPVEAALKKSLGAVSTKAIQAMYYLRMYDQRMHFTSQAITEGAPQRVEKLRKDGTREFLIESKPGANISQIVDILKRKDVVKAAGSPDAANKLFTLYLAKLRADRVGYGKLNFEAKKDEIINGFAEIDADPTLRAAFAEARDIYNQYNRNLLEFGVQSGAISRAIADQWIADKDYVPYYRMDNGIVTLNIGEQTPIRIGNLKDSPHLKELVGGKEAIFDFLTSSVMNTTMLIDMSMHNLAMKNLMHELRDVGLARISKETPKHRAPEGAVTFKVDGVDHFAIVDTKAVDVDSELLVKGLAGIPTMLPTFVRTMGVPSRILRRLVVASPVYMARQLVRDSTSAALSSGANMIPVIDALRQIGKTSVLQSRGITGGQVFTGMPEDMTRMLKDMQAGKISLSNGLAWLEAKSAQADALTRQAQYDSYIAQGLSEMEATMMALESMNFSRRGLSPGLHMVSTLIPFFNAQIQGLDVLYRSFTGQMPMNEKLDIQRKLIARGMVLFTMSMLYAAMMQDDEAYKNAKPEEKYGNWFVPLPGTDQKLRVPIPFELGYIFKALPEALVNIMANEEGGEEAMKALKHIVQQTVPGMSSYFMPQAVKPALEVLMGTSMYTGRSLESGREQQAEPGYRARESTTEIARWLGENTGFSPIKMEYLVRGYTTGLGVAFLQALSLPMSSTGPERAERRPSDLPVVGTLFQPSDASGIIDATYERMQELARKEKTYERLLEDGRKEDAAKYLQENAGVVGYESLAGRFRQQMGKITDYERKIRASDMTPQEKRQRLDEMRDAKIRLAAAYRDALKGAKDQGYRSGMGGSYGGAGASASF